MIQGPNTSPLCYLASKWEKIHLWTVLIRLNSELMHCSQDYLGLWLTRMEKRFMFSHLCSVDLLSFTSSQVRIPGDLIWRWALFCEHEAQQAGCTQLHGLTFASHLILGLAFQLGWTPPCPRMASHSLQAERGQESTHHYKVTNLAHAKPSWQSQPALLWCNFRSTGNNPICCLPKTYLSSHPQLVGLSWGLNFCHYEHIPLTFKASSPLKAKRSKRSNTLSLSLFMWSGGLQNTLFKALIWEWRGYT